MNGAARMIDGLHVEEHGRADGPPLLLVSGLGGSAGYWAAQRAALAPEFRVIAYDQRGTGRSRSGGGEALPDDYTVAHMEADVVAILDGLGIARCHLVGHALGGLVGLQLALDHPDRLDRLVAINAWARIDPVTERCFDARLALLAHAGSDAYAEAQPIFLYPSAWASEHAAQVAAEIRHAQAHFPDARDLRRRIAAIRAFDIEARLGAIRHRTLLIASRDDVLVPFTRSTSCAAGLPAARLAVLPHGGHAVNVTEQSDVDTLLLDFLQRPA